MKRFVFVGLGFLGAMAWAVPAMAQTTVKFQQGSNGYSGTMDTYIDKFVNDFFGGVERIEIRDWDGGATEKMNILIKFDVSSIPSNATVTSAKLTLYNTRARGQNGDVPVLEKVTSAWNNQSTWNMGVPSVVASGVTCPPVGNPPYVDEPADPPDASQAYVITGMEALVQGWMASAQTNYGVMMSVASNLNFQFASSEYSTVAVRPELSVTYTTPNMTPPPTVTVTSAPTTTTTSPITASGTSSATSPATVTGVTWLNTLTGVSGTASGTTSWTATIPLGRGSNTIMITVTDSNAGTASTSFSVDYTPPPKENKKGNHKICGLGAAGEATGSLPVVALGLLLLIGVATRRRA